MRSLTRKLLRDLWRLNDQALAIAAVMACGIATFVMSLSMIDSLEGALDTYYERYRFAEVFAHARRAPETLRPRLERLPGVARVETRITEAALLDLPGVAEPASARIASLPEAEGGGLNAVHLRSGRLPEGRDRREALVSQRFAEARGLLPGDSVTAILNGRREHLRIVGVALSPEFIYLVPPGALLPEHGRYAVFWMGREEMEAAFDMEGAFNDLLVNVMPGANRQAVIDGVDDLLDPFGGLGAYGRKDQPSHQILDNELRELRSMAFVVPTIFLAVSAFLLNLVLARLIATQREQIAALRALGYTRREIGAHYLLFALAVSCLASILGIAAGVWMGRGMTALYTDFFDFPVFDYRLAPRVAAIGLLTGPVAGGLAVLGAVRKAMTLPPAEAMRPPAPASYRVTLLERIGLHRWIPTWLRMVVRHLERRPVKTAMSVLGIGMATSILVVGSYTEDSIDYLLGFQFDRVQRRDLELVMGDETDGEVLSSIRALPGVVAVEPFRSVGVRLRRGHRERLTGILGLDRDDGMHQLVSMYGRHIDLPEHGVVLSSTLADLLDVRVNEFVTVEVMEGRRPVFDAPVTALIDEFSGLSAYMDLRALNRRLCEQGTIGGAYVRSDPAMLAAFYAEVKDTPRVAAVNVKAFTERSFRETIAENLGLMRTFFIGFSALIAVGVVYNGARVSLSERSRDLGTLRVVGFTRREVAAMQLAELAILTAIGVPLGLAMGYGLSWLTAVATQSELFRIPFVIYTGTFGLAVVVVLLASIASGGVVASRVRRLDLMAVLKSRE